jgi:hypothetical protein
MAWTGGKGVDGVIIAASAKGDDIVHQVASACCKRGRIILVGVVDLNLRRGDFYEKELTFQVSCSYGPGRYDEKYEQGGQDYPVGFVRWTEQRNFEAVLEAMRAGQLRVKELITHRLALEEAGDAYGRVLHDSEALGIIIEYPEGNEKGDSPNFSLREKRGQSPFPCFSSYFPSNCRGNWGGELRPDYPAAGLDTDEDVPGDGGGHQRGGCCPCRPKIQGGEGRFRPSANSG